ncbi:hypothetical protein AYO44_09420 [Planctomycetaceae bacterium SCGC AG-212-F19]|nr:hypothetical protein AYO44_09420 [Planctomycetaceae bacterium SCGC AG-212-F19]
MRSLRFCLVALTWALFVKLAAMAAPVTADPKAAPSAAEKTRKALDQVITMEFADQPLQAALAQLTEQTKLRFVLDRVTIAQVGAADPDLPVSAKFQDTKLRAALRSILSQYSLSFVLIDDAVLVTTQEMADYRQLQQRIDVDWQEVPVHQALAQLARRTGCNLILDRRVSAEARNSALTLTLTDASLETVVRIMAAEAGLSSVRLGNVLFVTSDEKAAKLRAEPESRPPGGADGVIPGGLMPGLPGAVPAGLAPPVKIIQGAVPAPPAPPPAPPPAEKPEKDK